MNIINIILFTTICENGNLELIKWLHKNYNIDKSEHGSYSQNENEGSDNEANNDDHDIDVGRDLSFEQSQKKLSASKQREGPPDRKEYGRANGLKIQWKS